MRRCLRRHLLTDPRMSQRSGLRVLDVGGADINGSYRGMFERLGATYTAIDISGGPGVDLVMVSPDHIEAPSGSFDVVVSGQTVEHCWNFWELFAEMVRVCADDGLIVLIAPSAGFEHRFPVDCYRFYPDSFAALAEMNSVHLVEVWRNPLGPFFDLAGVFRKQSPPAPVVADRDRVRALDDPVQNDAPEIGDPEIEILKGSMPARDFLQTLHDQLEPRGYVETGVWMGNSLKLARCPAIGIDPVPDIKVALEAHHHLAEMTAEEFFDDDESIAALPPIDLAYIDGMHLIEHALFDFINIERHAHPGSVIVIDDIFPNHRVQAERHRVSKAWTGDVWKIMHILREQRPDLIMLPIDTYPTGSLMIIGADPTNTTLWDMFDYIISFQTGHLDLPNKVLSRAGAMSPDDRLIATIMRRLRAARGDIDLDQIRDLVDGSLPRTVVRP